MIEMENGKGDKVINYHHSHRDFNLISAKSKTLLSTGSSDSSPDSGHFESEQLRNVAGIHNESPQQCPEIVNSSEGNKENNKALIGFRKFAVLLQDCLAIKFVDESELNFLEDESLLEDLSTVGIKLFKGLKEANLKCFWNATLCDAVSSLEYKGFLFPLTLLVGAEGMTSLNVVRTAWARKMLRCPLGYRIELVGDIEEFIAQPVGQSQFAPLSDSLCWAILELTSKGQEAFVPSIVAKLSFTFPGMAFPPREIIYQTLELLIRDRKVYQTSNGYFIVSPDTFRYMNANEGPSLTPGYNPCGTLDALTSQYYRGARTPENSSSTPISPGSTQGFGDQGGGRAQPLLRRHNSLKVIRQRDVEMLSPTMGERSLSLRLSKTKSLLLADAVSGAGANYQDVDHLQPSTKAETKAKKPNFFQRLFSFRKKDKKNSLPNLRFPREPKPDQTNFTGKEPNDAYEPIVPSMRFRAPLHVECQQGTSKAGALSLENLQRSPKIYAKLQPRPATYNQANANGLVPRPERASDEMSVSGRWNSLPSSSGRRSRRSILTDNPFYDVVNHQQQKRAPPPAPSSGYGSNVQLRARSQGSSGSRTLQGYQRSGASMGQCATPNRNSLLLLEQRRRSLSKSRLESPSPSAIYATIRNSNPTVPGQQQRVKTRRPRPHSLYEVVQGSGSGSRSCGSLSGRNGPNSATKVLFLPVQQSSSTGYNCVTKAEVNLRVPLGRTRRACSSGSLNNSSKNPPANIGKPNDKRGSDLEPEAEDNVRSKTSCVGSRQNGGEMLQELGAMSARVSVAVE